MAFFLNKRRRHNRREEAKQKMKIRKKCKNSLKDLNFKFSIFSLKRILVSLRLEKKKFIFDRKNPRLTFELKLSDISPPNFLSS